VEESPDGAPFGAPFTLALHLLSTGGWTCRNNPNFATRVHEIGGFALTPLPPAAFLTAPPLPRVIPEVFHGIARRRPFAPAVAGISPYRMFDRRSSRLDGGRWQSVLRMTVDPGCVKTPKTRKRGK
jgi:hypothetical protein